MSAAQRKETLEQRLNETLTPVSVCTSDSEGVQKFELNTTDKHNSFSETCAKCHNSAFFFFFFFFVWDDETVTDSDN